MSEATHEEIMAVNYGTVGELLGYSKSKLAGKKDELNKLVFSTVPLIERSEEVSELLSLRVSEVEQVYSAVSSSFQSMKAELGESLKVTARGGEFYPSMLSAVKDGAKILFFQGNVEYLQTPCISVVGTRHPSLAGEKRAQKIAVLLCQAGFTVVSGLAMGIDTAAHSAAIKSGGRTIAVIGTPLTKYYPRENKNLQDKIARDHLLVSQFPPSQPVSKFNFPVRNLTMGGLSIATVIVEAGETSGALHQAKYCLQSGRKLFLMKSLLENKELQWPQKYVDKGAIVISEIDDLLAEVSNFQVANDRSEQEIQQLKLFG